MKIVEVNAADLNLLSASLRPEHYVGFLLGGALLALTQDVTDDETANHLGFVRREYVARQKRNGDPTGLPVAPLYWTDLHPEPMDNLRDVMGQCEHGCVHMLNSTAEPHARWFVILGGGDDDDVTEFFDSLAAAEKYLKDHEADARSRYSDAIVEVKDLYRSGTLDDMTRAEQLMEDYPMDFRRGADDPGHVTIEGERIKIGGGEEPVDVSPGLAVETVEPIDAPTATADVIPAGTILSRVAAVESIKAHLRAGHNNSAESIAERYKIPVSYHPTDPNHFEIDFETFKVDRIVPRPSPETAVIVSVDLPGVTSREQAIRRSNTRPR